MDDVATVDAGPVLDTQAAETDSAPAEASETQAPPKVASGPSLKELLKREKNDPNVKFTDAELDVLDKHYENDAKPKTKAKAPEPDPEDDDTAELPVSKPKEKVEEDSDEDLDADDDSDSDSPEAKGLLKEVGAKSLKDALAKVRELKSKLGGKDAQAVAKLSKEKNDIISSGNALWKALRENDANAIAFAEKTFGVKFGQQQQAKAPAESTGDRFIDPDKFIDSESADLVEGGFQRLSNTIKAQADVIKALEAKFGTIEQERDRHVQDTVRQQSTMLVVDEMASIAQKHPALKGLTGFREIAKDYLSGKNDARMDAFNELFDIAKEENCSLKAAFDIKRGRDSDFLTATAKQEGRKEAYNQKPNPSLSGQTGGRGEASYQPVTPALLEKWESDHTSHPDSWYDKDENPIKSKIPKAAHKIFGF